MALTIRFIFFTLILWTTGYCWSAPTVSKDQLTDNSKLIELFSSLPYTTGMDLYKIGKIPQDEEGFEDQQNRLYNPTSTMYNVEWQSPEYGRLINIANYTKPMSVTKTSVKTTKSINLADQDVQQIHTTKESINSEVYGGKKQKRQIAFWNQIVDTVEKAFEIRTVLPKNTTTTPRPYWRLQFKHDTPHRRKHVYPEQFRPAPYQDEYNLEQFV